MIAMQRKLALHSIAYRKKQLERRTCGPRDTSARQTQLQLHSHAVLALHTPPIMPSQGIRSSAPEHLKGSISGRKDLCMIMIRVKVFIFQIKLNRRAQIEKKDDLIS